MCQKSRDSATHIDEYLVICSALPSQNNWKRVSCPTTSSSAETGDMATSAGFKVLYEHDGVFIHTNPERSEEQDSLTSGSLRVLDQDGDIVLEYKPVEDVDHSAMLCAAKESSSVFEWGQRHQGPSQDPGDKPTRQVEHHLGYETEWNMVHTVQFRKKPSNNEGAPPQPAPIPEKSKGSRLFFRLSDLVSVRVKEEGWSYLVFTLRDCNMGVELPALHFHQGGSEVFLDCLRKYLLLTESTTDASLLQVSPHSRALSQSFENLLDDATFGLITKFSQDPVTTTLGGFSKVTNYLFDAFRGPDTVLLKERPVGEVADLLNEAIPGLDINQLEEPGFEVITRIDLGVLPEVRRREPVGAEEWNTNMDPEGRMRNISHLKQTIFKGGLCHVLRKEGWKFLLGYFPWESTLEERRSLTRRKTDEYFRMKLQWKSVSEEQEKRNSMFRDHRSLIEKDVNRTDRTNTFYEGQDNPGLILLHDVLMTYCMYDFDLGYVQGMSDLLSPILYVMEDEVDAFWCFVSFMDQMHQNFEEQMQGMKTQLIQLSTLLRLLDLSFWNYLVAQDSGHLYFCFRWLLIRFKRELSFPDVLRLWEVMWTGLPCQNFHLLVCCAILDSEKHQIMEKQYGFNEILKLINELPMKLDIVAILNKAEAICLQLKSCKDLPNSVVEMLGFIDGTDTASSSQSEDTERTDRPDSPEPSTPPDDQQDLVSEDDPQRQQRDTHGTQRVTFTYRSQPG
ncbi:TBC1 domain family member 15 [Oncorhynchus mykiss]|uniref:TBC1 domain family member 15 n=1 Tax=Oncorhynchus mykiss TaxID=8022 RepID=A0A8K9WUP6_ONCMY|nr:TBC1 domain family member 15 [Oncorhynchus mykiss]